MTAPTFRQRLQAILATGRFANLPTVWTNVTVAAFLTTLARTGSPWTLSSSLVFVLVMAAFFGSLLYIGGCLLGDALDARWDAEHRPERPIPQGILGAGAVSIAAYVLLGIGWLGGCLLQLLWVLHDHGPSWWWQDFQTDPTTRFHYSFLFEQAVLCTFLTLCIILYARLHKRIGTGAPILMAFCRGLLVLWAGTAFLDPYENRLALLFTWVLPYALCIVVYTIVLSMVARNEANPDVKLPSLLLQLLFLLPPVGVVLFLSQQRPDVTPAPLAVALLAFLGWSAASLVTLRRSVPAYVSRALAGFCLVDACFAALLGGPLVAVCLLLFGLALLLQRVAPAT